MRGFITGFSSLLRGALFFLRRPGLSKYMIVPWLIALVLFGVFFALSYHLLFSHVNSWSWLTPPQDASAIARVLRGAVAVLIKIIAFLVLVFFNSLAVFLICGNIILGPFMEKLSFRVEQIYSPGSLLQDHLADVPWYGIIAGEVKKSLFFLAMGVCFFVLSLLPLIGVLFALLGTMAGVFFLGFAYLEIAMERRNWPLRRKLAYCRRHKALVLGLGAAVSLVLFVPLLNLVCGPVAVIGATLLFVDSRKKDLLGR